MKQRSGKGKRPAAHKLRTGIMNVLLWMIIVILGLLCGVAFVVVALRYYHTIFQH